MKFHVLRVNSGKLLGLVLVSSLGSVLVVYGLSVLDEYSSSLTAGVTTGLFFSGDQA